MTINRVVVRMLMGHLGMLVCFDSFILRGCLMLATGHLRNSILASKTGAMRKQGDEPGVGLIRFVLIALHCDFTSPDVCTMYENLRMFSPTEV